MALASVLSTRLSMEPEDEDLRELCERISSDVRWETTTEPVFLLVVAVLGLVARAPTRNGRLMGSEFYQSVPKRLSTTQGLSLSRVILQTIWRWRCVQGSTGVFGIGEVGAVCQALVADGDQMPNVLKTNFFLVSAISLGLQIDIGDLYPPGNKYADFSILSTS